ncbi:MAG: DNA polymerase I [Firmicutes bacterium]|nr:DNA polymerase I [Bacillota bacterium]MDY5335910.1 DNA polymerase I [Bacilli bacterium]
MKKIVLVDGNNLLFRSYYATLYTGNIMRNKDGFPTNGVYGFVNMINKIVNDEKPEYMMVAFDIGKTFRHEKYERYKDGRKETPDDLKVQFPIAKKILAAMGIKYLECAGYEADDIIGTVSMWCEKDPEYEALIVSSDKDLLQLISDETTVKLLKTKDYIMMDRKTFNETYGFEPIHMIDLKALMGDASDNIPGVRGIGEKGAIKLVSEYTTIENIYANINNIKGATQTKLIEGKDDAYYSKDLVTIYREVPLDVSFDDLKYKNCNIEELTNIYKDLGFYSLLKKLDDVIEEDEKKEEHNSIDNFKVITDINEVKINEETAIWLDTTIGNYHDAELLGISLYNNNLAYYIPFDILKNNYNVLNTEFNLFTYDYKKLIVIFNRYGIKVPKIGFDTMISAYLLNYETKDDIAYLANNMNFNIHIYDKKEVVSDEEASKRAILKAKFIYTSKKELYNKMKEEDTIYLFENIEMPLAKVLAKMEIEGIRVDKNILKEMGEEIKIKLELITKDIYNYAGCEFNINSPKQLGEILFEKLNLPYGKKNKSGGYTTDADVLKKLVDYPIVNCILEYRALTKLYSTYIDGMINCIREDGKIHTIYTQTLTRTGRLSSIEPNLQNIPMRSEYGRLIRKAFIPESNSVILSSDYSQIELRVFAHLSGVNDLINAFNEGIDIHTKTAMDIFKVPQEGVTKNMRRQAKAVNFGILYGISSYGLAEDLGIPVKEAKEFINKYFDTYPGVRDYMDKEIETAKKNGYVKTIMNRKRVIDELKSTNYMIRNMGERMALNTPVQGSASDILKKAMIEIDEIFEKENIKSKMLLQVHDELIFNVYDDEIDKVKEIVYNTMTNVFNLKVPLDVDIELGNNWYEAK